MEDILLACPLFKGITGKDLNSILEKYNYKVREFNANDFVLLQGDSCENMMIIISGKLQAQMVDSSGKMIVVEELGSGQILAPAFLFSAQNKMPVSLFTTERTSVFYIRKQTFTELMQASQPILLNFLQMISERAVFLSKKLNFHVFKSIKNKIAGYVLEMYEREKSLHLRFEQTQQNLSEQFGVTRPSLARSLAEMEKEGVFILTGKNIEITDLKKLRELAE